MEKIKNKENIVGKQKKNVDKILYRLLQSKFYFSTMLSSKTVFRQLNSRLSIINNFIVLGYDHFCMEHDVLCVGPDRHLD